MLKRFESCRFCSKIVYEKVIINFKESFMQKISVFLLQDTNEQNDELMKLFTQEKDFEVVGQTTDGISAVSMVAELRPDLIILEIILSGYDGLSVISKIKALNLHTKVVVLSALRRDEIVKKAVSLGADYFMAKLFSFSILQERVREICLEKDKKEEVEMSKLNKSSIEEKISNIFLNVGIPAHIKGYAFLREGVKLAMNRPEVITHITKMLHPMISEKYNTTASKVERAIRHAIEVAWNRGRIETINNILGVRAYIGAEKPTNGEFIALVADKMLLEKM
jgi:two-component system response regulator (stage 0 sporulation protein A)